MLLRPSRAHTKTQNDAPTRTHAASVFLSLLEIPKVTRCENAMWGKPRKEKGDGAMKARGQKASWAGGCGEEEGIRA